MNKNPHSFLFWKRCSLNESSRCFNFESLSTERLSTQRFLLLVARKLVSVSFFGALLQLPEPETFISPQMRMQHIGLSVSIQCRRMAPRGPPELPKNPNYYWQRHHKRPSDERNFLQKWFKFRHFCSVQFWKVRKRLVSYSNKTKPNTGKLFSLFLLFCQKLETFFFYRRSIMRLFP